MSSSLVCQRMKTSCDSVKAVAVESCPCKVLLFCWLKPGHTGDHLLRLTIWCPIADKLSLQSRTEHRLQFMTRFSFDVPTVDVFILRLVARIIVNQVCCYTLI